MADAVRVTALDVGAALPLARPAEEGRLSYTVTTLRIGADAPSRRGRLRGSGRGKGISVTVDPSPVPDGALEWATQVRFPRGVDIPRALAGVGLEWPVWWAVGQGEMTTLVERARLLSFVGFAHPTLALPWFVRLHAAATGTDPLTPVPVTGSVHAPLRPNHEVNFATILDDVRTSVHSDHLKLQAYEEWQARAVAAGDPDGTG